jgi:hypothetical protein
MTDHDKRYLLMLPIVLAICNMIASCSILGKVCELELRANREDTQKGLDSLRGVTR